MAWSRRFPFRVDVAGIIHIMGTALYSRPQAAFRELVQNSHDAIVRRQQVDLNYRGRIHIRQHPELGQLTIEDDGIGLTDSEAERYLGTLGIGITGLLKGEHPESMVQPTQAGLIGQFGIGLFSGFMLADRIELETRKVDASEGVRWSAGLGNDIELTSHDKAETGTLVRLHLRPEMMPWCLDPALLERAVRDYADYLPIPIYLNDNSARINLIHSEWFDPTPEMESLEMELAAHFDESPLDVIPIHVSQPVAISGALYVTPERLPGFSSAATVKATVMRMVVSSHVEELLPEWASFVRGVVELPACRPTASREELVRDQAFVAARAAIEERLFSHFEELSRTAPVRFQSLLTWHRYMWAGHALTTPRLRHLMHHTYPFQTSQGTLTAQAIIERSRASALVETDFEYVVWYNTDRRQERWINSVFAQHQVPCVHATRSFEESLLTALVADQSHQYTIDLRYTSPSSPGFASSILGVRDIDEAPADWCEFLEVIEARVMCADFREDVPVMAFLNERADLQQTFDELKKQGTIPSAFQRIIDRHMLEQPSCRNEVLLNRRHRLVNRALSQKTNSPLASVLRLLVAQSLTAAGAPLPGGMQQIQTDDLDWITDALWGKN